MTIFFISFGYIPTSPTPLPPLPPPSKFVAKKAIIPPICSKFNFVWGGRGGVASFTNITEKVATRLTSIVASIQGKGHFFWVPKHGFNLHSGDTYTCKHSKGDSEVAICTKGTSAQEICGFVELYNPFIFSCFRIILASDHRTSCK